VLQTWQVAIASSAANVVHGWTGCEAHVLGSCAVGLSLPSSDIDLGLSHSGMHDAVETALVPRAAKVGVASTPSGGVKTTYRFRHMDVDIDVCLYDDADLAAELLLLTHIRGRLTPDDTAAQLWIRHLLHQRGDLVRCARWKAALVAHAGADAAAGT
jgi:hypothetical protein